MKFSLNNPQTSSFLILKKESIKMLLLMNFFFEIIQTQTNSSVLMFLQLLFKSKTKKTFHNLISFKSFLKLCLNNPQMSSFLILKKKGIKQLL